VDRYETLQASRSSTTSPAARVPLLSITPVDRADVWVGEHTARVALDVGDGDIEPEEVEWAVRGVLAQRGSALPDLPLERIVATAYVNGPPVIGMDPQAPGCPGLAFCRGDFRDFDYAHPDHQAVTRAVGGLADLAADGAWVTTYPHDPHSDATFAMSRDVYDQLMGLGSELEETPESQVRYGAQQVAFGWLTRHAWRRGITASGLNGVLFPQFQSFRHISSDGSGGDQESVTEAKGPQWLAFMLNR
jgi:hypothetical protein